MISDFVADLRAPTPSAAIEMILPDSQEILYTLGEYTERFKHSMHQKLQQTLRELKHVEEMLVRSSPLRQLNESQVEFKRLEEEFGRVIQYKIERFSSYLPEVQKSFTQNIHFILQQKEQHLEYLIKKTNMSDPQLQCRKGWAQVSQDGQPIELNILQVDQKFVLEDASVKIEAVCLEKHIYRK